MDLSSAVTRHENAATFDPQLSQVEQAADLDFGCGHGTGGGGQRRTQPDVSRERLFNGSIVKRIRNRWLTNGCRQSNTTLNQDCHTARQAILKALWDSLAC